MFDTSLNMAKLWESIYCIFRIFTDLLHILLRDMRLLLNVFLLRTAGLRPPIGEGGREPVGDDAYVLGFLPNKRLYTRLARFIFDPFFLKKSGRIPMVCTDYYI